MRAIGGRERGVSGRPTGVSQAHRQSIRLPAFGDAVIVQVMQQLGLMLEPSSGMLDATVVWIPERGFLKDRGYIASRLPCIMLY